MHPAIPRLLELQTIDQHIAALRAELDAFPKRVREADLKLTGARNAVAAERKALHAQHAAKKKDLDAALAEREPAIAPIPEDLRVLYERIAKRHHGVALAEARDGQCRGCGMRVLPHILQQLIQDANDELFRCESCGLILYSLEPIPAPNTETGSGSTASSSSSSS